MPDQVFVPMVAYEDGAFFLASHPSDGDAYEGPRRHAKTCARAWLQTPYIVDGVLVHVDDVDAHYARALAAGTKILTPIEENPLQRQYRCEDLEGHRWMFATPAKR